MTKCTIKEAGFDLLPGDAATKQRTAIAEGEANEDGPYWVWPTSKGKPNPNYWGGEVFTSPIGCEVIHG